MQKSSILNKPKQLIALFVILLSCQACGKSTLVSSWTNTSFTGPVTGTILVIGVFNDPIPQKIYEDSFVQHLTDLGLTAVPSYKYNLGKIQPTKSAIQKAVKQAGAETILITHLLSETTSTEEFSQVGTQYVGFYYDSYWGYHAMAYDNVWAASNTLERRVDRMEASLFDAKTGKTIWVARSKSVNYEDYLRKDDDELEAIFIKDLKKHKLL